jgi:hypothetical protein
MRRPFPGVGTKGRLIDETWEPVILAQLGSFELPPRS